MTQFQDGWSKKRAAYEQGRQAGAVARGGQTFTAPVMLDDLPEWHRGYAVGLEGGLIPIPDPNAPA